MDMRKIVRIGTMARTHPFWENPTLFQGVCIYADGTPG